MSDSDKKLQKIAEQNRLRQARFYASHKNEILAKKQTDRDQLKILNTPPPPAPIIATEFTCDMILDIFRANIDNENTLNKYSNDIKRVFLLTGLEKFTGSLNEYISIKDKFDNSNYSVSTIKGSFQSILVFINHSKIDIPKAVASKYDKQHKIFTIRYEDAIKVRMSAMKHSVITFQDYLKKVLDRYGAESKQYLVASLYHEVTCRDNFGSLKILRKVPYDNGVDNFLYIDEDKRCTVILNKYKTNKVYGKIVRMLSPELSALLNSYIERNKLSGYLFPDDITKGLTRFICEKLNRPIGISGGINSIRHMRVSEFLCQPDLTPEMRLRFATDMGHSESTQQKYQREIMS
jgi:hypothetical protein